MLLIKCPFCGKRHTVKILYGLPTHEAFLDEQLGKIKLGGCIIMDDSPTRYCSDCNASFGKYSGKIGRIGRILFFIGGLWGENNWIDISLNANSYILNHRRTLEYKAKKNTPDSPIEQVRALSKEDILKLENTIQKTYLREWAAEYADNDILDGTQWSIELECQGENRIEIYGSNEFPPYFKEFVNALSKLVGGKLF